MVGPISSTSHYILLANSSFLEICDINFSVPSMLSSFLAKTETIFYMAVSYHSTSSSFYATEPFFLALMAFDRCVAICHPPYYPTIMTRKSVEPCVCLLDGWLFLLCHYSFPSFIFSGSNAINHYFCDCTAMLGISCVPVSKTTLTYSKFSALMTFIILFSILCPTVWSFELWFSIPKLQ